MRLVNYKGVLYKRVKVKSNSQDNFYYCCSLCDVGDIECGVASKLADSCIGLDLETDSFGYMKSLKNPVVEVN